MRVYILEVIGQERARLTINQGVQPLWTLDFKGTVTREQAVQEAVDFLKKRGERLVQLFFHDRDDAAGIVRYRIAMD